MFYTHPFGPFAPYRWRDGWESPCTSRAARAVLARPKSRSSSGGHVNKPIPTTTSMGCYIVAVLPYRGSDSSLCSVSLIWLSAYLLNQAHTQPCTR